MLRVNGIERRELIKLFHLRGDSQGGIWDSQGGGVRGEGWGEHVGIYIYVDNGVDNRKITTGRSSTISTMGE